MARYLVIWRQNPVAPWPTDPAEGLKLTESMWAGIDASMKKGQIKDYGAFLDGRSGYAIGEGDPADVLRSVGMFMPFVISEVHEVVPYEKEKEAWRDVYKAWIKARK